MGLFGRKKNYPDDILEYRNESVIQRVMHEQDESRVTVLAWFVEMLKFLQLCADSEDMLAPTDPVDHCWHAFILHMQDYEAFCQYYFGKVIYHQPSGEPDSHALERTRVAYRSVYGAPPTYAGMDPIWPYLWISTVGQPDSDHSSEATSTPSPDGGVPDTSSNCSSSSCTGFGSSCSSSSGSSCSSSSCSSGSSCGGASCGGGGV